MMFEGDDIETDWRVEDDEEEYRVGDGWKTVE